MNRLGVTVMVAVAMIGGALALTTLYDQPAKVGAGVRMDWAQITMTAKNLPIGQHENRSIVN